MQMMCASTGDNKHSVSERCHVEQSKNQSFPVGATCMQALAERGRARTVMEVSCVMVSAYESTRPNVDAAPRCSTVSTAAAKAASAPSVSRRTLSHLHRDTCQHWPACLSSTQKQIRPHPSATPTTQIKYTYSADRYPWCALWQHRSPGLHETPVTDLRQHDPPVASRTLRTQGTGSLLQARLFMDMLTSDMTTEASTSAALRLARRSSAR